jgi:uncharacterized repeat protein (TIGR03803 family)
MRISSLMVAVALSACSQPTLPLNSPDLTARAIRLDGFALARHYRLVHSFGKGSDGLTPLAGLVNVNGTLYGTTQYGGAGGNGTVFSFDVHGTEKVVYSFVGGSTNGAEPVAAVAAVGDTLYGTTESGGGMKNPGTVFMLDTATGKEKPIHLFGTGTDGTQPMGRLLVAGGNLYGTTAAGGIDNEGTVFSIVTTGSNTETVMHSFGLQTDGATPEAGLVEMRGVLYGTTSAGGMGGDGTVYGITTAGVESVIANFDCNNGKTPVASLRVVNSALYGTTAAGGNNCGSGEYGSVFSVTSGGALRTVYSFGSVPDANIPLANVIAVGGTLYGTTSDGGFHGTGTIYKVAPGGRERVIHNFGDQDDGTHPAAGLLRVGSTFYGTTSEGGIYGGGTIFAFTP